MHASKLFSKHIDYESVLLVLSAILIVSLIYSVYLLSVSMFLFGLLSLLKIESGKITLKLRQDFIEKVNQILSKPAWWIISFSFFIVLFGGLYSDDTAYWFSRLRIKAPFLLLPMAFYLLPGISKQTYLKVHLILTLVVFLSTLPIVWYMINNYNAVVESLQHGRPVSTPISHIRYSLLVTLALCSSFLLSKSDMPFLAANKKWFHLLLIYLILFLHFLAVRSGLLAFYTMSLIYLFSRFVRSGKIISSLSILALFAILPFAAYHLIPSFKKRIVYMLEDASKYQIQEWNAYSDAERILSIKAGIALGRQHPWFGSGSADLKTEMKDYFYEHFDKDTYIMPHNQFVSIFAANGLIGLSFFMLAFFIPLVLNQAYYNPFFLSLHIIVLVSLMVENTFETSVGVAFYLFFMLLGLNQSKTSRSKDLLWP